ncbi:hypothetical protein [Okeania hirsuta]|uniref:hypothetical protein n=1 Tax=Okeania hirsuta TaxID=1458930 RepID=UPI0026AD5B14
MAYTRLPRKVWKAWIMSCGDEALSEQGLVLRSWKALQMFNKEMSQEIANNIDRAEEVLATKA